MENDLFKQTMPNLIRGKPGKPLLRTGRATRWTLSALSVASIISPFNGVDGITSQTLANEEIVKQAAGNHALGNGVVREPPASKRKNPVILFDEPTSANALLVS